MIDDIVVYSDNDDLEVFSGEEDIELYAECDSAITVTIAGLSEQIAAATEALQFSLQSFFGTPILVGEYGYMYVPYDCVIQEVVALADQSGSIVVDVWVDSYANFPPTDSDSIVGGNPITLSSTRTYRDDSLAGWTVALTEGSIIAFNVDSITDINGLNITFKVLKS